MSQLTKRNACTLAPEYWPKIRLRGFKTHVEMVFMSDICQLHDDLYDMHKNRWTADLEFMNDIINRGFPTFGIMAWVAVRLFGWIFYPKRRKK